jgi:hypothetical protein
MSRKGTIALLVIGAVSAVAVLELWQQSRKEEAALAQPVARNPSAATPTRDDTSIFTGRLVRERLSGEVTGEPFGAREAPRAIAAPPPPAPVAAPFPYRYAGQLSFEDGKRRVYLAKGNEFVLINTGDVLDGVFKVTAIAKDALEVLHVPTAIATRMQYSAMSADAPGTGAATQPSVQASSTPQATSGTPSGPGQGAAGLRPGETPSPFIGSGIGSAPVIPTALGPAPAASAGASVADIATGSVPTGRLGSPGPTAGATPLGVAPSGSGSMPMLPAPVGVMRTLPPPTGRLGL